MGKFHGSPKETHTSSAGKGTKELTVGSTPGKMATRVKPSVGKMSFEKNSGKTPKTGRPYTEE